MRDPQISLDVAEVIGPERLDAINDGREMAAGKCPTCSQPVDRREHDTTIIIEVPELQPSLSVARLAHATCSPSQITILTAAAEAARRLPGEPEPDGSTEVTMLPTTAPLGDIGIRPALLWTTAMSVHIITESGDQVDGLAQHLLGQGWHLTTTWTDDPPPAPRGWYLDWRSSLITGHHLATILGPGDDHLADAHMQVQARWIKAASHRQRLAVYYAPLPLNTWTDGIDHDALMTAIRSGQVIGTTLPFTSTSA